jgi:site-specific DNA-methyltransferase (adenine-specific)
MMVVKEAPPAPGLVYDDELVAIYQGDGRALSKALGLKPDLVLTDPPYGTGDVIGGASGNALAARKGPLMPNGDVPFDPTWLLVRYPRLILFGAVHYAHRLPPSRGWLVWDKLDGMKPSRVYGDAELAWTNIHTGIRIFRHRWMGAVTATERGEKRTHPAQKPIALMQAIIERFTQPGDLVLDPFCGTGATVIAARRAGRRAVGIELLPSWAEAAAARLEAEE